MSIDFFLKKYKMENFRKLNVPEDILRSIKELGFDTPTEIQELSIPIIMKGKDLIAGAPTGSGKTLAFGCGVIHSTKRGDGIQALILTPTRELADQNTRELKKFSKHKPLNIVEIFGGVSISPQIDKLARADIVVGTPGRILDHLQRQTINLSKVRTLVLDEADRMVDMGFIDDVEMIMRQCQKKRQTLLFSATITQEVKSISRRYMAAPEIVTIDSGVDPKKLRQSYYNVPQNMKISLLVHLIKNEKSQLVMVFCNTKHNADFVARNLKVAGINALAIHGGFSQDKRTRTMESFHSKNIHVMVCTDVAARGLDVKGVTHVYNYDIPKESKQYIHRIGRTARAGEEGEGVNLLAPPDFDNFSRVLRDNDVKVHKKELPQFEKLRSIAKIDDRGEGRFGQRRSFGGSQGHGSRFGPRRSFGGSHDRGESRGSHGEGSSFGDRPRFGARRDGQDNRGEGGSFGERRPSFGARREGQGSHEGGQRFGPRRSSGPRRFGSR